MNNEDVRYGFVGIITAHAAGQGQAIQRILADHADLILGRMGLPHLEDGKLGVITLIVRGSPAGLAALTGQLGRLKGVSVKSGMAAGLDVAASQAESGSTAGSAPGEARAGSGTGETGGGGSFSGGTSETDDTATSRKGKSR